MRRGGAQRIPRPPATRPGAPAPWVALEPSRRRFPLAEVRRRLADLPPGRPAEARVDRSVPAAVLVPLFEEGGETRLILTKRPETMPSHQGEIAFPGGKMDPGDADLVATAQREALEEIGLPPDDVEIVARLDGLSTVASRFVITPYVGVLPGRPLLAPDPVEVVKVFDVSLAELTDPDAYREERWDVDVRDFAVHFYELPGETVWGATARILTGFLTHLTEAA